MFRWWQMALVRSGADGGAGGGSEGAGGGAGEGAAPPATGATPPADGAAPPATRPEWLPEQFKTPEDLARSYTELRGAFSKKEDAIREKVLADLREGVPADPKEYKVAVDPKWLPEGFEARPISADDPLMSKALPILHRLGAKQDDLNQLTEAFVAWQASTFPNMAEERKALGDNADARIAAVDTFLAKHLDEAQYRAVMDLAVTAPAIAALEKLMALSEPRAPGDGGPQGVAGNGLQITSQQAAEFMRHPDYYHSHKGAEMRSKVSAFIRAGGRVEGYKPGG